MLSFLLVSLNAFTQVKNLGLPFIINYTAEDYKASKQNWMVVEDNRGVVYFANNMGVLEFDGQNWNLIKITDNSLVVRALRIDKNGVIYVGSPGEFGYLKPDSVGALKYVSLVDKIENEKDRKFLGINTIFSAGDKVYFATDDYLFEYTNGRIITHYHEKLKQTCEINGRIFMKFSGKGIFEWKNGVLTELSQKGEHNDISLRTVLPYGDDILFVTMEHGVLLFDNKKITKLNLEIDQFLKQNKIISAIQLTDGNYAFGMLSAGLIITNNKGEVLQHIDTQVGLQGGLVSNILQSRDGNLWLSTGNSITYLMSSLPLTIYDKKYALNAATYSSLSDNDILYIASSVGLFYRSWTGKEKHLNTIEQFKQIGLPINVLQLDTLNGKLLAATNAGINVIEGTKITPIPLETIAVWKFLRLNGSPNLAIIGTGKGLKLLEFQENKSKLKGKKKELDGTWVFKNDIKGFLDRCRHIVIDNQNNIWFAEKTEGIKKLVLNDKLDSVSIYSYNEGKGLENGGQNCFIFELKNKVVIGTDDRLYYYDSQQDKFVEDEQLNLSIGEGVKIILLVQDNDGNIWYKQQRTIKHTSEEVFELGQLILQSDGSYLNYKTPFYKLKNNIYSITPMKNGDVIVGTDKGFVHYDSQIAKDYSLPFRALIRKVEFIANDSLIFDGAFEDSSGNVGLTQKEHQIYKIPYQFNDIRFNFSSPYFDSPDQIQYKYFLESNDKGWSDWKTKSFKEYSNLSPGDYVFRVVAKNVYEMESIEATYYFTILPPWYWTIWALIGYVILIVLLLWGIVRLSVRRLRKQKEHLEEVVKERTKEIRMKNTELEQQKEEILAQRDEIEAQKDKLSETNDKLTITNDILAIKNKNITASITYAKRIQEAMLPLRDKIQQNLDDHFILFKPRDIVSGDFYWFAQKNNKIIFTAVDCTGHGVPGAFMSMIGSEILTTIVNQGITTPSEILDYKNKYVRKALKQEQTENQDGMDMSLCTIDKQNKLIEWAGAKNPLVYIQNNELFHIKGDMQSIGGHQMTKDERKFTNYSISYAEGPTYFYIFTDGFQDQFGGPKNRKFMVKKLKDLIFENYQKPMKEQEKILNIAIETWMKNTEQTDDILVIGFKLVP